MEAGNRQDGFEVVQEDDGEDVRSSTEEVDSDDSEEDPTYDVLEETCTGLSKLSLKRSKSHASRAADSARKLEVDDAEMIEVPELTETDKKCFEKVQRIIKAGGLEKLTVEQCKAYLRKKGLRLTGRKDILIKRIREHLSIIDGGGEKKYPISSFVLNCKGDACTGDVVMFEQNVYEMFSIASRSATGPPIGTRIVAGRIVKESYGAAKQQHTFTIEVLWSKGQKPLPPLHPLLVKGRNLYRLKTMRQKWDDEEERKNILVEKHSRGFLARSNRETRVQEKEMRKRLKGHRGMAKNTPLCQDTQLQPKQTSSMTNPLQTVQPVKQLQPGESARHENELTWSQQHKLAAQTNAGMCLGNNAQPQSKSLAQNSIAHGQKSRGSIVGTERYQNTGVLGRPPLTTLNSSPRLTHHVVVRENRSFSPLYQNANDKLNMQEIPRFNSPSRRRALTEGHTWQHVCEYNVRGRCYCRDNCKYLHEVTEKCVNGKMLKGHMRQQYCRFYAQGNCRYGYSCKYLHEREREGDVWMLR